MSGQIARSGDSLGDATSCRVTATRVRFCNAFLEPFWNHEHVESVQTTMAEDFGVLGRGVFYEQTGVETFVALRLSVDNWRWQGVPFFIRASKSLV